VVIKEEVKASSEKRRSKQDFPTPESPIRRSLIKKSYAALRAAIDCRDQIEDKVG
jgi:hypothetical protein